MVRKRGCICGGGSSGLDMALFFFVVVVVVVVCDVNKLVTCHLPLRHRSHLLSHHLIAPKIENEMASERVRK